MRTYLAFLFFALGIANSALAQSSTGELTDQPADHRIAADLGFFYRSQGSADIGILQPSLYGTFTLTRFQDGFLQLDAAWRFVGLFGDQSAFRALNPYLGVRLGAGAHDGEWAWRARGGLGLTLPLSNAYDDVGAIGGGGSAGFLAQLLAGPMQGMTDVWLGGTLLSMALVARGDVEVRHPYFVAGGDLAFATFVPIPYQGRTGDSAFGLQLGVFAGGRPIPELVLGVRFNALALFATNRPAGASNTEGYTALTPFVRGEIGNAFIEGRLVMNLDEPFGFAFDSMPSGGLLGVWCAQVSGGASF